jgi:predicted secreted acid phosphatase
MDVQGIINILEKNKNINNRAVVYDIDDTMIFSSGYPNKEVIYTYNYAKKLGYTLFIITAREGNYKNMKYTVEQLRKNNISGFKRIYFRPKDKTDIYRYKLLSRKNIYDNNYNTILSVGDMHWDIGKYGGIGIKI